MKRGTPEHPKMMLLAVELGIPKAVCVGILETLWHWTARYVPQGDVGKYPDKVIEYYSGWSEVVALLPNFVATESRLVNALVKTGWLDRDDQCRLFVHDWHDHSDDAADKYLSDHGLQYANGEKTRRSPKVTTESRQESPRVAISPASHTHTHLHTQTHSPDEGEGRDSSAPDGHEEFTGTNGTFEAAFKALRETGKMDQLLYDHVVKVAQEFPLAQIHEPEQYAQIVLELRGVAGKVGAVLPWLRKAASRLEVRTVEGMQKKPAAEGPRSREFVGEAHE